ncbi:MAG: TrlF family AAA-like ATPase [Candidatus Hodarchaeota archaeon]
MPTRYPKGSEWRRWDLHIHTPESALYNKFSGWNTYLAALKGADKTICAIGITDYASIEGYKKVLKEKLESDRLSNFELIIPNIEFRISPETKTGKGINIHFLIDPKDPDHITRIEEALGRLNFQYGRQQYACTREGLIRLGKDYNSELKDDNRAYREGINQFKPSFEVIRKWYQEDGWLHANALVAVSNKSDDGASGLAHDDGFHATREEIYRFAHIVFSGNPKDREYFLGKGVDSVETLKTRIGGLRPCVHGSDAHTEEKLFKPDEDRYCWIKADPTFEGLRQILYEPEARLYIGRTVPDSRDENRIIKSMYFRNSSDWFEKVELPINPALVSIIGSKGSGKTALADLIAHATGSWENNKDSFIYKAHKEIIGTEVTVNWVSGHPDVAVIGKKLEEGQTKKVRYLSQHMVEKLCSEDRIGKELVHEIEQVIFEYIDDTEKLGKTTFADLRTAKTEGIREQKIRIRSAITRLNQEIQTLESEIQSKPLKKQRIHELEKEKKGLEKQKPTFNSKEEQKLEEDLAKLRDLRQETIEKISSQKQMIEKISNIRHRLNAFTEDMAEFYAGLSEELSLVGIEKNTFENFRPQFKGDIVTPLNQRQAQLEEQISENVGVEDDSYPEKMTQKALEKRITELEEKSTLDQAKKKKSVEIQRRIKSIDAEIKKLKKAIEAIESTTAKQLANKTNDRWAKYLAYFDNLRSEQKILEGLYSSLSDVLGGGSDEEQSLEFYIKWQADADGWASEGEKLLDQRKQGLYRATGDLANAAKKRIEQHWIKGDKDNIKKALQELRETFDDEEGKYNLQSQLLTNINKAKFYDWLFSTEHISLNYGIKYDGVELENLSPGTKGIVLLILYLEMDKNDRRPLLMDQPEENLDNESVYKVLTEYFQRAKQRRQIILITHNPNLVVNTDSEQVIVASFRKAPPAGESKIRYSSGSLEYSKKDPTGEDVGTREKVCEILEGGETAFHMREQKYAFGRA